MIVTFLSSMCIKPELHAAAATTEELFPNDAADADPLVELLRARYEVPVHHGRTGGRC